jgi:DNA-directed RNA polymerase subunit alpha
LSEEFDNEKLTVLISGKKRFLAGDLNQHLHNFQVLNPDLIIANMSKDVKLNITISIIKGRGYIPSEENRNTDQEFGVIAIDSIFTPILNVKYTIENYRVEQKTDYEKLVFEIETDGSIHPKEALKEASKILIHHFMLFSDEKIILETEDKLKGEDFDEEILKMRQTLKTKLVDMDLSVRALNCLKAANVETLAELVTYNRNDLLKFRNFGKKSLTELDDLLTSMGINFGMDILKYKLDKD